MRSQNQTSTKLRCPGKFRSIYKKAFSTHSLGKVMSREFQFDKELKNKKREHLQVTSNQPKP